MNFAMSERPCEEAHSPSPEPVDLPPPPSPDSELSGSTENSRDPQFVETVPYSRQNQVSTVILQGIPIVSLVMDGVERLCLAQISNTLLKSFSYNEIHNRRVALGITCVQCTPVQLEILRRAGAMPISSRRCGMITKREAERLVRSFLGDTSPPKLPDNFAFEVRHDCGWGCHGKFVPSRYNSSRAKCIKCNFCNIFFSPNKFIFHFHRTANAKYHHPDAANFNSWRRHLQLDITPTTTKDLIYAWEDVKAMFNGGSRKRLVSSPKSSCSGQDMDKRPRLSEQENNLPKLTGISYPYPVLPLANNAAAAAAAAAAACSIPGYMPRPPHPAFPGFPMSEDSFQPHESSSKVQEQNNFAELWKNKASPYCNPFGFLWAKNFGMYNDQSLQYRNVIDLSRSAQKPGSGIEAKPEDMSSIRLNMPWQTLGKMAVERKPEPVNYFSAFKPVARETAKPERRPSTASPVQDDKWPLRPQSIDSCNSHLLDNDVADDVDDENINVTDIDSSDLLRSPLLPAKEESRVPPTRQSERPDPRSCNTPPKPLNLQQSDSDEGQTDHELNHEKQSPGKSITDSSNNNGTDSFYHMSKEELQRELCKLLDERSKAEQEYHNILDAIQSKKSDSTEKKDTSDHLKLFDECLSPSATLEKKEKEALFSKLQEAHDALRHFSTKMVALRNSIHT